MILDQTAAAMSTNMRDTHIEAMHVFRVVLGLDSVLIQKVFTSAKETYLTNIRNHSSNSITVTIVYLLTHLQENYGYRMPQKLIYREETTNNTVY